jgi:predicted SAM-dependent methyltransferase
MASLRKLLNRGLSSLRLELRRLPPKISPTSSAHEVLWNSEIQLFKNYHVGCGSILASGFLNIDDSPLGNKYDFHEHYIYEVKEIPGAFILKYDLSQGLPAQSNSLMKIYHSHFLEHLNRDQGVKFFKDCFNSLASGGVMRFALPDFRLWCTNYIEGNSNFFNWYRSNFLPVDEYHYQTPAQIFTGMLFNHGHQMAYDFESLASLLGKIGFKNIAIGTWGESLHFEQLQLLEAQDSQRRNESLIIECHK